MRPKPHGPLSRLDPPPVPAPRSRTIAQQGLRTSQDYLDFLAALTVDLGNEAVRPQVGNAQCNVIAKTLKLVELQHKYGQDVPGDPAAAKVLRITRR